ncbi:MAG: VOC family protein [Propionibacteriaceae bacterium]
MAERPRMALRGIVLDSLDPRGLAGFYRELLGWSIGDDEPEWVTLQPPEGGAGLSFQVEPEYVRPVWPSHSEDQEMMVHLDIEVDDLAAASAYAEGLGATLAEFQPQDLVRVYLDPAGHPFCLYLGG